MLDTGQIIPFSGSRDVVSRDDITAAVQLWRFERDLSEALTREEIGAMKMLDRVDAQRKTLIIGFAMYLRAHPRSDVAMGVYLVLTLLSDNDKGLATVSQPTLAKLFCRSVSSIADAQKRLREMGLIGMTRGRYAGAFPVIPRFVTQQYNHLTWIVGALADAGKNANHPAEPVGCQSSGRTGCLAQSSGAASGLERVNHPVEPASINRPDAILFQKDNSEERKGEVPGRIMGKVAAAVATALAAAPASLAAAPHPVEHVLHAAAECWQTPKATYDAGVNVHEKRAQKQIWMTPLGVLEVAGDFKAELEREFPLVDLKEGLAVAAPNVRVSEGAIRCMQAVRRSFSYRQRDAVNQASRAASFKRPEANLL